MNNTDVPQIPLTVRMVTWLKRNYLSLLALFFAVAIVVGLYFFAYRYPDKVREFETYGYLGAFLISLVTNATVVLPVPGFVLLFALGAACNPILIGLTAGIGGAIGEMTAYLLGYSGRGVIKNVKFYDRAVFWLRKWGSLTVFVFAATPLPFDVLGIGAGALRFPVWKFFTACFFGKTVLYTILALAGAWGWESVLRWFGG